MFLSAEDEHVRLYADALKLLDTVLRRLGLQLSCCLKVRNVGKVYVYGALSEFPFQLSDSLQERRTLYVADCSSNLSDDEVVVVFLSEQFDVSLYLIGDMRYHLNGLSKIVAPALLVYHRFVYTSGCHGVGFRRLNAGEALVMAQVQVCLHSVNGDIALSMLVRI